MNEREKVLLRREGAARALLVTGREWCSADANTEAALLFPLPTRTVPTVRQGPSNRWLRVREVLWLPDCNWFNVMSYSSLDAARAGIGGEHGWHPADQPTVAALLALPLTEQVEDTGEDGAK